MTGTIKKSKVRQLEDRKWDISGWGNLKWDIWQDPPEQEKEIPLRTGYKAASRRM
jgi:hypothetical protein